MIQNARDFKKSLNKSGSFYTQDERLLAILKQLVDYEPRTVYDPTCGVGNLLSIYPNAELYGQDINSEAIRYCEKHLKGHFVCGDVLTNPAWLGKTFDLVIANIPFSLKGEVAMDSRFFGMDLPSINDFAFIWHCLKYTHNTAVVVVSPGFLYRQKKEAKVRKLLLPHIEKVLISPPKLFVDTQIPVAVLKLTALRQPFIEFVDLKNKTQKTILKADIDDECNLSPNRYVDIPKQKAEEWGEKEQTWLFSSMLNNIKKQIDINLLLADRCEILDNVDLTISFIDEIEKVSKDYKKRLVELGLHRKPTPFDKYRRIYGTSRAQIP